MLDIKSKLASGFNRVKDYIDRDNTRSGVQLLSPTQNRKISAVKDFTKRGFQGVSNSIRTNPQQYNIFSQQSLQKGIDSGNYLMDRASNPFVRAGLGFGSSTIKNYKSGFNNVNQGIRNKNISQTATGVWQSVAPSLALAGGGGAVAAQAGITGGFNAALAKIQGEDPSKAFGEGAFSGLKTRAITRFTDPVIGKAVSNVGGNFIQKQLAQRGIAGIGNVAEDEIIAKFDGYKNTNPERALSFALGAVSAGNSDLLPKGLKQRIQRFIKGGSKSRLTGKRTSEARQLVQEVGNAFASKGGSYLRKGNRFAGSVAGKAQEVFSGVFNNRNIKQVGNKFEISYTNPISRKQINETIDSKVLSLALDKNTNLAQLSGSMRNKVNQARFLLGVNEDNISNVAGAGLGLELERDEQGNVTGVKYNPTKGALGVGLMIGKNKLGNNLRPKDALEKQIKQLEPTAFQDIASNRQRAEVNQELRSGFKDIIKDVNRLKAMARSKSAQAGDIETLRKKDGKLVDTLVERYREVVGNENIPDTQAIEEVLNLPTKTDSVFKTPDSVKELRELKKIYNNTRNLVYNSEVDLKTKQKAIKENLNEMGKLAQEDFRAWEKQLVKQESLKRSQGQVTRNIETIGQILSDKSVPGYARTIKKDISSMDTGFKDVYRNFDKVFGKNSKAHKEILEPFDKSKGQMVDDLSKWADDLETNIVKKLGIEKGSKLSAAVQEYGEGKVDFGTIKSRFGEANAKKIVEADKWFRKSYDNLLDQVNAARKLVYPNNPEKLIKRRSDYYRHFVDLSDTFSGLRNLFDGPANISPELEGLSARTKPKSKWLSFAQKRIGDRTDLDAVGGFIEYIKAQSYAKNIDPHINKFRVLRDDLVKYTDDPKTPEYAQVNNFIRFLDQFSNDLAGKTNEFDRNIQNLVGRKTMKVVNWLNNRTKANLIVGNLSSSVAQWFNLPQGIAEAGVNNYRKGVAQTIANMFGEDTPISQSNFIKERYSGDIFSRFDKGILANAEKAAVWITGIGDEVATKSIWNSLYEKAVNQGIKNPINYADDITRKMVAGRGVGEVPLVQKAKSFQLIAPFQLEVANVWHVMAEWLGEKAAGKFVTFFVASHLMNRGAEFVRGSDVSLDPIQAMKEAYQAYSEEENKKTGAVRAGGRLLGEVISNVPVGQSAAMIYPKFGFQVGDTKMPTREQFFGDADPTRFGSGVLLQKAAQNPAFMLLPKYGGKQLERTLDGLKSYAKGYSESRSGRVRFPVEQNATNLLRSATFGQYSTPEAREYFDQDRSTLGEKQSEAFKAEPKSGQKGFYDAIMANRSGASQNPQSATSTNLSAIEVKRDNKIPLTDQEATLFYQSKLKEFDSSTRYGRELAESNKWDVINTLGNDDKISEQQKLKVAEGLGLKPQEYAYYQVTKQSSDARHGYILDSIDGIKDRKELLKTLMSFRYEVRSGSGSTKYRILSNTGIDRLYDEGVIGPNEKRILKDYVWDSDKNGIVSSSSKKSGKSGKQKKFITDSEMLAAFNKLTNSYIQLSQSQSSKQNKTLGDYFSSRRKQFNLVK